MQAYSTFRAPWSRNVNYLTFTIIIAFGVVATMWRVKLRPGNDFYSIATAAIPLLVVMTGSLFMIQGYIVEDNTLFVRRLLWNSKIDLTDLISFEFDKGAMSGSIRTFGNGGFFCIAGCFYNSKLGRFRAYATDPDLAVVLRFSNRTIVVTPEDPRLFITVLKERNT